MPTVRPPVAWTPLVRYRRANCLMCRQGAEFAAAEWAIDHVNRLRDHIVALEEGTVSTVWAESVPPGGNDD